MTARSRPRRASHAAHVAKKATTSHGAVLPNGLQVRLCPTPHLSQCYVTVLFGVGSRHETPATNGITHVLEHMLFRGTKSFPEATQLNAAAENLGGFLEGATYRDHVLFATACHPSTVEQALAILGELVAAPRYRGMEVEREILREELLEALDSRGRMVDLDNISHRAIFGKHPLGMSIEGSLANLDSFQLQHVEAHRQQFLVGANTVVAVAGPIDPDRALRAVHKHFGQIPAGSRSASRAPQALGQGAPVLRYVRDPGSQVDIRLSFPAVSPKDASYPALVMLARLLADGLASRMYAELVDKRGLAYSLHAGLTTYEDCGLFEFDVAVAPDRAALVVQAIMEFVHSAGRFRYRAEELQRARRRYRYGLEFMRDDPVELASWHARLALFGVERPMAELGKRLDRVTDGEIRQAARDVFQTQSVVLTAVGELARGEWGKIRGAMARTKQA